MENRTTERDIRLVDKSDYEAILLMVEASEEGQASLFLISALLDPPPGLKLYAEYCGSQLVGIAATLPNLPPFGVPVILSLGDISSDLLCRIADVEASPQMALGSVKPTSALVDVWPVKWNPLIAKREEVLLQQSELFQVVNQPNLSTRAAVHKDIETLVEYRISMEKDSETAIVSTSSEARTTITDLIDRQMLTVVEVCGKVGGCAAISASDSKYEQLGFVYVEPQHRLLGVSDRLLSAICTEIHNRGRLPISFTTRSGSLHNRLTNLGFKEIGEHLKLYFRS